MMDGILFFCPFSRCSRLGCAPPPITRAFVLIDEPFPLSRGTALFVFCASVRQGRERPKNKKTPTLRVEDPISPEGLILSKKRGEEGGLALHCHRSFRGRRQCVSSSSESSKRQNHSNCLHERFLSVDKPHKRCKNNTLFFQRVNTFHSKK